MADSTITFSDAKSRSEDLLDIDDSSSDLTNKTVVIAVQDFLALYQQEEMRRYPDKWKRNITLDVNIGGVNQIPLSSISENLYGTKLGFVVRWNDEMGDRLFEVREGGRHQGFVVKNGVLQLYGFGKNQVNQKLYIQYYDKPEVYSIRDADQYFDESDPTVIPIHQGMEQGLEFFIAYRYTERDQGDPSKAINYRNSSLREMQQFFTLNRAVVAL